MAEQRTEQLTQADTDVVVSDETETLTSSDTTKPTRRRLLIPLIVVLVLIMSGFAAAFYTIFQSNLRHAGERNLEMAVYDLEHGLADRTRLITTLQEVYVTDPAMQHALEAQDRQKLLEIGGPIFQQVHRLHNITHFYYHNTTGVNILRVHQPQRFGDTISRETMRQAMVSGEIASGIELGPLGTFTLRVVMPVRDSENQIIGYLELGQEIEDVLMATCEGRNLEMAISIHKENLNREGWERGMQMLHRAADWEQYQDEVLIFDSMESAPDWSNLLHQITLDDAHNSLKSGDRSFPHDHTALHVHPSSLEYLNGQWWHTMSEPISDASGRIVGELFVFNNVTAVMARVKKVAIIGTGGGLACLILLIGFLYSALCKVDQSIVLRENELRSKNQNLAASLSREQAIRIELEAVMSRLEVAATTDELTSLPNRAMFMDILCEQMQKSDKDGSRYAVLFLDFDRFKVVNDSLGHRVGDALLCDIAKRLRQSLSEEDVVARFGGDEFVVLLKNLASWFEAELTARALLDILSAPHRLDDYLIVSTASIGLVTSEHPYDDPDAMIRDADVAMYQAKGAGKARVTIFDRNMHVSAMDRMRLEADLQMALAAGNQFFLVYQPIVDLESGHLHGFEALLRWERPGQGLVSPADFIPVAEDTGMIVDIGRWVMETAAAQIAKWNKELSLILPVSININITKQQLLSQSFISDLLGCKERHQLGDDVLHLEITESTIANNREEVIPLLHQLRENGFKIAMDDFGTGVSSLSALHEYPIDILKIDQAFIRVLDRDRSLLAVVTSITSLADNLNIETVAEGIESQYVVGALQSINCTWGQGYLFAKPLAADVAEKYIRQNNSGIPFAA